MAYDKMPPLKNFKQAEKDIMEYLVQNPSKYYMLLNNDTHYYTMFVLKDDVNRKKMLQEVIDISRSLGNIKDIVMPEKIGQGLEIWIDIEGFGALMFLLFNYSQGVIEI